jgi:hypothetical protein
MRRHGCACERRFRRSRWPPVWWLESRPGRQATLLCRCSHIDASLLSSQLAGPPATRWSTNRTQARNSIEGGGDPVGSPPPSPVRDAFRLSQTSRCGEPRRPAGRQPQPKTQALPSAWGGCHAPIRSRRRSWVVADDTTSVGQARAWSTDRLRASPSPAQDPARPTGQQLQRHLPASSRPAGPPLRPKSAVKCRSSPKPESNLGRSAVPALVTVSSANRPAVVDRKPGR